MPSVCCPVALRGDTTATNCDRALISPTYSLDKDTLSQSNTILHESSIANTGLKYSPSSDSSPSLTVSHPLQVPSPLSTRTIYCVPVPLQWPLSTPALLFLQNGVSFNPIPLGVTFGLFLQHLAFCCLYIASQLYHRRSHHSQSPYSTTVLHPYYRLF